MDIKTTFANRFSDLCGDSAQAEVAQAIGISRATVGYYKSGDRSPDVSTLFKIARHFNVSADYLIGLSDATQPENSDIVERLGLSEDAIDALSDIKMESERKQKEFASEGIEACLLDIDILNRLILYGEKNGLFDYLSRACAEMVVTTKDFIEERKAYLATKDTSVDIKEDIKRFWETREERFKEHRAFELLAKSKGYALISVEELIEHKLQFADSVYQATLDEVLSPVQVPYIKAANGEFDDGNE